MVTKLEKAGQIEAVILAVARYYATDTQKIMRSFSNRCEKISKCRRVIWHHMHNQGMSIPSIAKIFALGHDHVGRFIKQGPSSFSEEDFALIKTLPVISTTLELTKK